MVFNDGLSKYTLAAMADSISSTGDLPLYVLDRLLILATNLCWMLMIETTMMFKHNYLSRNLMFVLKPDHLSIQGTMMLANCTLVYNCVQQKR